MMPFKPAVRNRELDPKEFRRFCGTDRERRLIEAPIADRFVELRCPRGRRDFEPKDYWQLYRHCYPNPNEQSPLSEMIGSLLEMNRIDGSAKLQGKYGKLRYHDILALRGREVIGFTSFATMPLIEYSSIVYNIYTGVADPKFLRNRYGSDPAPIGISDMFYPLRHGMAEEDAKKLGYKGFVRGTILESNFIGQANDERGIRYTKGLLEFHQYQGALTLMIDAGSGCWITPCVQPSLSEDSKPILLHLLYRKQEVHAGELSHISEIDIDLVRGLMRSYALNFDYQSSEEEIRFMRDFVDSRLRAAKRLILVPPEHLPDIVELARMDPVLKAQVERDHGPLEKHAERIKSALG
jgi:hypothetical protein